MTGNQVRQKYLDFFAKRGHIIIPPAPLVLENDPSTLFTSSGMQPLVPYLLGQTHPEGKRLADSQPSFRSQDIEEVGDNRHTTFFEMLGNWSLGDYFKKEQLPWVLEFLTSELELPVEKLAVTVFEGNEKIGKDTESMEIWQSLGIPENRIFAYPAKKNWWSRAGEPEQMPAGEPGGPDSEVFFEFTGVEHDSKFGDHCHPNCDCGRFLEIGNSVFMQYQKQEDGSLKELAQKNVDFGGGLERLTAATNNDPDVFNTDLFSKIVAGLEKLTGKKYLDNATGFRIIADHIKAATFLIANGVVPSNKLQGYVLRRLLRRAAVKMRGLDFKTITDAVIETYAQAYPQLTKDKEKIETVIAAEVEKFNKTLEAGLKLVGKTSPFDLLQSYGFPVEITRELLQEQGLEFDEQSFAREMNAHQEKSRAALAGGSIK